MHKALGSMPSTEKRERKKRKKGRKEERANRQWLLKEKQRERETEKESATFTSNRSLLGRGELRGTLGHQ
jgi:hypothetical protein